MIDRLLKTVAAQTNGSFCTRREMLIVAGDFVHHTFRVGDFEAVGDGAGFLCAGTPERRIVGKQYAPKPRETRILTSAHTTSS